MTDVFVAYKSEDHARVKRLIDALKKQGFSVWWDREIDGGGRWRERLENALTAARCVLAVWTHGSTGPDGEFVVEEADWGRTRRILVPVRLDNVRPPFGFRELQTIDLISWSGSTRDPNFKRLTDAIRSKLDSDGPSELPVPPPAPEGNPSPSKSETSHRSHWLRLGLITVAVLSGMWGLYKWASKPPPPPVGPVTPDNLTSSPAENIPPRTCQQILQASSKPLPAPSASAPAGQASAVTGASRANQAMGLTSGPAGLTYYRMAQDLADVAMRRGLALMPMETNGTLDNIARLAGPENAGVGFVQSDVGIFLPYSDKNSGLKEKIGKLGLIMALHTEEVHVLARKQIKTWADLKGKRVVVAKNSQGSRVTAKNLFRLTGMEIEQLDDSSQSLEEAACSVIEGKADAMIVTAGKPIPLLTAITTLPATARDQIHLLPIPDAPHAVYANIDIPAGTYPWQAESVRTLSVRALLIAYDFSARETPYAAKRCAEVQSLKDILDKDLASLKVRENTGEKWRETFTGLTVSNWRLDRCAHPTERR